MRIVLSEKRWLLSVGIFFYVGSWNPTTLEVRSACEKSAVCSSEKTIAILGDKWWPQATKQEGNNSSKTNLCSIWKQRNERPNVGDVSIRSRDGAPS